MNARSLYATCLVSLVAVSGCGGSDVDSEAETVDVGVSVEPGTVAMNLIDLSKVKFKYQIKNCKSGYTKAATADFVGSSESVKMFKNDTGCVAELVAIQLNGTNYTDVLAKDGKTVVTINTTTLKGAVTAAAAGVPAASAVYYFYKSSADTKFVLKVPDQTTFDTSKASNIRFTFESIRSDIVEKKVQGVSVAQGLSVGALESPNFTLLETNLTWNTVADQKVVGGTTYYGGLLKASFDCDDAKVTTEGGKNFCRTPGLDKQDLSKMTAVLVAGRASGSTGALTYDEAVAKFNAANSISAGVSGSKDANDRALFDNIPYYQNSVLGGSSNAWLIVRMQDQDGAGNKFESYTVFNVTFTNN